MKDKNYWINTYSASAWGEFVQNGAGLTAFVKRRWRSVKHMEPGDHLLCYVKEVSSFIGVLEVAAAPYMGDQPLFKDEFAPGRIDVKPVAILSGEAAIPVLEFQDRLGIFHNATDPNAWTSHFRNSPALWDAYDGATVMKAVVEAAGAVGEAEPDGGLKLFASPLGRVSVPDDGPAAEESPGAGPRVGIACALLALGAGLGLSVWAAPYYRGRETEGRRVSDVPRLLSRLPEALDGALGATLERVDVVWLDGAHVAAAIVIDSGGSIHSRLLRLADLFTLNNDIPLYVSAPDHLKPMAAIELHRPAFASGGRPLSEAVRFIPFKAIRARAERGAGAEGKHAAGQLLDELAEAVNAV